MIHVVSVGVSAAVLLMTARCGGSGSDRKPASPSTSSDTGQASVRIVAIGDSDTTGIGDETGKGWVGRYGDLVKQKLSRPVAVDNHAAEGKTSDQLRLEVTGDDSLRKAMGDADVVLIGIGGADLNAGDDELGAGRCAGRGCYAQLLRTFDVNIKAIASEVRRLAPTALLRAISLPNSAPGGADVIPPFITPDIARYQTTAERASVCQAMQANQGQCADVVRAFNGPTASADAYAPGLLTKNPCCYPSAKAQQLMAELLVATGLQGL